MTIGQKIEIITAEGILYPPAHLYSDEPPLETELHLRQIILLLESLEWLWHQRNDFYAMGNLTIHYSPYQQKPNDFRGPDFFVVLNTERKPRKSWVVWEENGQYPHVIIEILSSSTAADKNQKKEIYQNTFRTPEYYWYDPDTLEVQGFYLVNGQYQPIKVDEEGRLPSKQLGLSLGVVGQYLRFFTSIGDLVQNPTEVATLAEQKASIAEQKLQEETIKVNVAEQKAQAEAMKASVAEQKASIAEQKLQEEIVKANVAGQKAQAEAMKTYVAQQKAQRLAAKLKELNIDPDNL